MKIRKEFYYERKLPKNYTDSDFIKFTSIRTCHVSPALIEKVTKVKVVQYYLFSGYRLMEDFCLPIQKRGKINVLKQWIKLKLFPQFKMNEALWVTDIWSKNYFHWILECLPRLLVLHEYGFKLPLLIPEHIYQANHIKESLDDLGVEVITFNLKQTVKVSSLIVASHDAPCAFDPTYLQNVVYKFQEVDKHNTSLVYRRIYISRRAASKRKVKNEEEIIPILKSFGFEVLQTEDLSFKMQRQLMRETSVLISIHGAGLANMIFMPKNSKIIELHPDTERYNSCFYHLAAAIGLDYYYSFEEADHPNPQEANITVDTLNLHNMLKSL